MSSEASFRKPSHQGSPALDVLIHSSIKQELCHMSFQNVLPWKTPMFYVTLQQATEQSQDGYRRCWAFPTYIWAPISRLSETEAKASDPQLHLAVSLKWLQVSPSAVLEKAGSLQKTRLGQMLRTDSGTLTAAICRCSHEQRGQWKQRHDQALCKAGSYLTIAAAMARSPSEKPPI